MINSLKKYFCCSSDSLAEQERQYDIFPNEEKDPVSSRFFLLRMRDIIRSHRKGLATREEEKNLRKFRHQDLESR